MKRKIYLASAIILFGIFFLFTAIITNIDIQAIGPNDSSVGLATVNGAFADAVGYNEPWYNVSELAGLIPLAMAGCFALFGLYQAIKRKSLLKVDSHLFVLAGFYAAVLAVYVAFEFVEINFRPVLMDGVLEASYPSSHTMLSLCICTTAIFELHELIKSKKALLIVADAFCVIVALIVLLGRALSGVHWLTDIVAGVIISASLICLYRFFVLLIQSKQKAKEN